MSSFPRMHVSLYVTDIDESVVFYTSFFGKAPQKVEKGYAKFVIDSPSLIISFIENPERVQSNFGHLGIQVETEDELKRYLSVAQKRGLEIKEEMGTNCCYALQDKFWVTDPDGVQWEVYYFHSDAVFNDPRYEKEEASACCMPPEKAEKPKVKMSDLQLNSCTPESGCC